MPSSSDSICYPFARAANGSLVHVDAHAKGAVANCLGCGSPMVARQGQQRRWHFAHASTGGPSCSEETALHEAAKLAIRDGFIAARAAGRPYMVRWACGACATVRQVDAASHWTDAANEATPTEGVRSDVLLTGERASFAIEVVVTHDVEAETLARYRAARVGVGVVRPSWETISALAAGVRLDRLLVTRDPRCEVCREREREAERERQRQLAMRASEARAANEALDAIKQYLSQVRPPSPDRQLRNWDKNREGADIPAHVQEQLAIQTRSLVAAGFRQASTKPWLFSLEMPGSVRAFASLSGARVDPVPGDAEAHLWISLTLPSHPLRAAERTVFGLVVSHVAAHGVVLSRAASGDYGNRTDRHPFALDQAGRLVEAGDASRARSYQCAGCGREITVSGALPHFRHTDGGCSTDRATLAIAALLLRERLLSRDQTLVIKRRCPGLGVGRRCNQFASVEVPQVDRVALEPMRVGEGICDVIGFTAATPTVRFRLFCTKPPATEKLDGVSLLVVRVDDVLSGGRSDVPWLADQTSFEAPCKACTETAERFRIRSEGEYVRAEVACPTCRQYTPVYAWCPEWVDRIPPEPRPHNVVMVSVGESRRSTWSNVCTACGSPIEKRLLFGRNAPFDRSFR